MAKAAYNHPVFRAARQRLAGLPCYLCGDPSTQVDHIRPLAQGGTNDPSNLAPICQPCNSRTGGKLGAKLARKRRRTGERNRRYR